jgi:hypothetical protein
VVILSPKREFNGPKTPPTSSSYRKKLVTRKNLDPKPLTIIQDLEKLIRKPKIIPGQYSLSKGKFPSIISHGQPNEIIKLQSDEEVIPGSEIKLVIEPITVSFHSTLS